MSEWDEFKRFAKIMAGILRASEIVEIESHEVGALLDEEEFMPVEEYPPGFLPEQDEIGYREGKRYIFRDE